MKHEIRLSDGTWITSGTGQLPAVASVKLTRWANQQEQLTYGAVSADVLELELFATEDLLREGERIELWQVEEEKSLAGIFYLQKPERKSPLRLSCTAADSVSLLDRDVTGALARLTDWPYSMGQLADWVCRECGAEFSTPNFPGASLSVEKLTLSQVTGRQLLGWIAAAAGRFCRANIQGQLEFLDYTLTDLYLGEAEDHLWLIRESTLRLSCPEIAVQAEGTRLSLDWQELSVQQQGADLTIFLPRQCYYYENTFSLAGEGYQPPQKVQLRKTQNDVGVVYPQVEGEVDTYILQGNPLLSGAAQQDLQQLAQELYETLQSHSYTPCKLTVPQELNILPGQILKLCRNGVVHRVYVMKQTLSGQRLTLECTAKNYGSSPMVNESRLGQLGGRMLELEMGLDGLRAEHTDSANKTASLELSLDGIRAQVDSVQEESIRRISTLEQDEQSLQLRLERVENQGVSQVVTSTGYSFTQDGLRIQKSGQEMENLLDHTGMYVRRSGEVILQASSRGVEAVDVSVGNYLSVGHARFEEYDNDRTACYYIALGG